MSPETRAQRAEFRLSASELEMLREIAEAERVNQSDVIRRLLAARHAELFANITIAQIVAITREDGGGHDGADIFNRLPPEQRGRTSVPEVQRFAEVAARLGRVRAKSTPKGTVFYPIR